MGAIFYILSFLSLLTVYVDKAPHNIATSILVIFSAFIVYKYKNQTIEILKQHKIFFLSSIAFFIVYGLINFKHFGWDDGLFYALKRCRWVIYMFLITPAAVIITEHKRISFKLSNKIIRCFFYIFFILFSVIFVNEIFKIFHETLSTQGLYIKSSHETRASWSYNPVPFSKLSFFGILIMIFFLWKLHTLGEKTLAGVQIALMSILTVLSQTRASWLGALVAFLVVISVLAIQKKPRFALNSLGLFVLLASALFFTPSLNSRLQSIFTTNSFSNRYRIEHWKANLKLIEDHFFFGVGDNNNRKESVIGPYLNVEVLEKYTTDKERIYNGPHNEYLDIGAGAGFLSLVLFMVCFVYPVIINTYTVLYQHHPITILSLAYIIFMYFTLIFDKINYMNWAPVICCWVIGFIFYSNNQDSNTSTETIGS